VSYTLHLLFEEQYNELWLAADLIAERISTLGLSAPGSYSEFSKRTYLQEVKGNPNAVEMISELLSDHEVCTGPIRFALSLARAKGDAATEDLLTQRLIAHEKAAWMLRNLMTEERQEVRSSVV
jgi:starvation-inducible DNA-binding protein